MLDEMLKNAALFSGRIDVTTSFVDESERVSKVSPFREKHMMSTPTVILRMVVERCQAFTECLNLATTNEWSQFNIMLR